jgi:hypothetical protein
VPVKRDARCAVRYVSRRVGPPRERLAALRAQARRRGVPSCE